MKTGPTKLTAVQRSVWERMSYTKPQSAYELQVSLGVLNGMRSKGAVRNVTPPGPGEMFSPPTHYKFIRMPL